MDCAGGSLARACCSGVEGGARNSIPAGRFPITAWEIATLSAKAKLSLDASPEIWFDRFCALPGVSLADMPPSVLVASTSLPGVPPRDPADRILIATARAYELTLVTRDGEILEYGGEGHVRALAC